MPVLLCGNTGMFEIYSSLPHNSLLTQLNAKYEEVWSHFSSDDTLLNIPDGYAVGDNILHCWSGIMTAGMPRRRSAVQTTVNNVNDEPSFMNLNVKVQCMTLKAHLSWSLYITSVYRGNLQGRVALYILFSSSCLKKVYWHFTSSFSLINYKQRRLKTKSKSWFENVDISQPCCVCLSLGLNFNQFCLTLSWQRWWADRWRGRGRRGWTLPSCWRESLLWTFRAALPSSPNIVSGRWSGWPGEDTSKRRNICLSFSK